MSVTLMEGEHLNILAQTVDEKKPEEAAAWLAAIVASSFDAIVGKTLAGTVTSWNKAATTLFGYREEDMIGQSIRRVIPQDRQDEETQILARIASGECIEHYETVRRHKDGGAIDVSVTVSPVRDGAGKIIGASKIVRDITRCKRAEELQREQDFSKHKGTEDALCAAKQRLAAILEALPIGVAFVDAQSRILVANEVYKRFVPGFAPSRDEAGAMRWEAYDDTGRRLERRDFPGARALRGEPMWPGTEFLFHGDENRGPIWTRVAVLPFRAEDGAILGATAIIVDIDEEKRTRDALIESELRMRLAQEAAHAGVWEWRLADNRNQWSDSLWALYGLAHEQCAPSYEAWATSIHAEDCERVTAEVSAAAAARQEIAVQWRVKLPKGEPERWLFARGRPIAGANGIPDRYIGIVIDITERKRMEEALQESRERQSFLLTLNDALREISDPVEIMATASELLGRKLGAGQIAYAAIDEENEHAIVSRDWNDGTIPSNAAVHRLEDFGAAFIADLKRGQTIVIDDVRADPRTSTPEALAAFERVSIGAFLNLPLVKAGRLVAVLAVHVRTPRAWRQDEVALAQEVAERTWEAVERARVEQTLRESEERLRFSLKGSGAAAWQYDIVKNEQIWSPESYELHGRDPRLGKPRYEDWLQCLHPDDRGRVEKMAFESIKKRSSEYRTEYRVVFPSGEVRWLDALGKVDYAADGTPLRMSGINLDITERKRAEEALRQAGELQRQKREELETILAAIPAAVFIAEDPDCVRMTGNRAAYDLLRLPSHISLSKSAPPEQAPKNFEVFSDGRRLSPGELPIQQSAIQKRAVIGAEHEIRFVDGDNKIVRVNALPLLDDAGEVRGAVGAFADITDLKRTEAALRESEERLKFALEAAGAGTWRLAPETGELTASDRALVLLGLPPAMPITHEKALSAVHPEDQVRVEEALQNTFDRAAPFEMEMRVPLSDGSIRWLESRGELLSVSGTKAISGLVRDITKRKRAEVALRESEEEARKTSSILKAALESMADAVFISDTKGRFTHFNDAFATFSGFKNKDECATRLTDYDALGALFLPCGEIVPLEEWPLPRALRGEAAKQAEYIIKRKDGEPYCVASCTYAPIRNSSGEITGAVVTSRDITQQRRAENRLRESEARLSSIIDTAADGVIVIDEKGTIQSANRATTRMFGYSLEHLVGRNVSILMPAACRCDHDRYFDGFSRTGAAKEVEAQRQNGETVPLDVAVAEWRDGEGRRFFTGILRDLSERKRNEEALARASRLEAVGQLAGGVAHDFNNLLAVIAGNLELAEDGITDKTTRELVRRALDLAEKGSGLTRRLLSLARKSALKPQRLSLNSRVEETARLLVATIGEQIALSHDLAADLWMTLADPGEIDSAILNIAANARDAMPSGGRLAIVTSNVTLDKTLAKRLHPDARPGDYVRLAIADDGHGMQQEILGKAMEPFFTTKKPGAGTGLGLTSVASFAKQTSGFAVIESALGQGCTVSIYLPRSLETSMAHVVPASEVPLGDGEFVLVVEDDDQVREVTLRRVEALGYAVAEARTGLEAIELLLSGAPIQLVLSDIVMPGGLTGYDVARWVASNKPDIKVILCSGYNEGDRGGDVQEPIGDVIVLGKPFGRDQLARTLKNALTHAA